MHTINQTSLHHITDLSDLHIGVYVSVAQDDPSNRWVSIEVEDAKITMFLEKHQSAIDLLTRIAEIAETGRNTAILHDVDNVNKIVKETEDE